jgi:hypothetical protein
MTLPAPIDVWFDFASPYAYLMRQPLQDLAARHGRSLAWRPVILWAVLKQQGIVPVAESPVKWAYLVKDMRRSAAFHGVPFGNPRMPMSSHAAARFYYAVTAERPELAEPLIDALFAAQMIEDRPLSEPDTLIAIAARHGIDKADATAAIEGPVGRERLAAAVAEAVAAGVFGSPFVILDGEPFFGADRLPQIAWRLSRSAAGDGLGEEANAGVEGSVRPSPSRGQESPA